MDTLQGDINALEADKARLNERIKDLSKSNLLLQMQTHGSAGAGGAAGGGGGVKDSPMLLQQIEVLRSALCTVKAENTRLLGHKMKTQLASLPPLRVPKKPVGLATTTGESMSVHVHVTAFSELMCLFLLRCWY